MVSSGNLFNNFVSHPGVPFLCRIVGKPSGFDIEIFDTTHEKAWACRVTSEVLVLDNDTSTTLPWEKAKAFLEVGIMSRGAAEDVALDFVEQLEEVAVLQLRLRFGIQGCLWSPTLRFVLKRVNAERHEKMELQASIANMESQLSKKAAAMHSHPTLKTASYIGAAGGTARGIAFASVTPYRVDTYSSNIFWEPTRKFDDKFLLVKHSGVQVCESGFAQVSIVLRHSNCRSNIAFKVYKSGAEISSVYDYTCGLFSIGISSAYVHTIPVDANDTISVKYVGGGTLFTWDSFMDVLLLPTTTH
ncbi:hypothetical protein GN244_ATG02020 [Phytophthora infestans]|uniref:Uncharacterized protein n=1 Tax=Phytophthora infestans TaxID=4787 RepID=A0A833T1E2_PHYIN|nr:hypothetical protein GN244_ATG02020 [Phytophthora infestans]